MKVSLNWLKELSGIADISADEAARTLTMAGWNVEEVVPIDLSEILVGRVLTQVPHPGSRKPLWIHQVDLGGQQRQIIAGAPTPCPGRWCRWPCPEPRFRPGPRSGTARSS